MRTTLRPVLLSALLSQALLVNCPTAVLAETAPDNQMAASNAAESASQSQQAPDKFIQSIGDQAVAVMADKSQTPDQRSQKYHEILRNSFDMASIGHFVLGRAWNSATPEQQQKFMKLFEQLVLRTYGDHLNFYSGEKFQVKGARPESDKDSIVSSEVVPANGGQPTKIDWRVRQENGKPAVLDVVIEGVSQSVTERQEYSSILQRNNGNMDALLNIMQQRLQKPQQQSDASQIR
jgi:phospholipid transport system substrate-binding protein